jgi:hypothetical protein
MTNVWAKECPRTAAGKQLRAGLPQALDVRRLGRGEKNRQARLFCATHVLHYGDALVALARVLPPALGSLQLSRLTRRNGRLLQGRRQTCRAVENPLGEIEVAGLVEVLNEHPEANRLASFDDEPAPIHVGASGTTSRLGRLSGEDADPRIAWNAGLESRPRDMRIAAPSLG